MDTFIFRQTSVKTVGDELARTDGTAAGTTLIKDLRAGKKSSNPRDFFVFDNAVYFFADIEDANLDGLYRTDGTAAGTVLITTMKQFFVSAYYEFLVADNYFFFNALDKEEGQELWQSDGTENGTFIVQDLYAGSSNDGDPQYLTVFNDALYFAATDKEHGRELFKYDLPLRSANESAFEVISNMTAAASPNPFTNETSLTVTTADPNASCVIIISDVLGKRIEEIHSLASETIAAGKNLASGIYFVRVQSGNEVTTLKIIKDE
jgi:ELWxxDGT repeat protein